MYNHHLTTFLEVADSGSFMKAADKMFISATAITKQINLLEDHLNIKLFHRSSKGLVLTEAGKLIYDEAKNIIRLSDSVLQRARELEERQEFVIKVGVSLMNPSKILLEQWAKAAEQYPNIKLQIVPFEDEANEFFDIIENFGRRIDVIPCCYLWDIRCNSFYLQDLPFCVAVSKTHKLSSRQSISISDLYRERLIMLKKGISDHTDKLRALLVNEHPQVQIEDVDVYGYYLFNQVAAGNDVLLSAECWSEVHPLLSTIPVDWPFTIPYGLVYSKEPAREVLQFIMAIGKVN